MDSHMQACVRFYSFVFFLEQIENPGSLLNFKWKRCGLMKNGKNKGSNSQQQCMTNNENSNNRRYNSIHPKIVLRLKIRANLWSCRCMCCRCQDLNVFKRFFLILFIQQLNVCAKNVAANATNNMQKKLNKYIIQKKLQYFLICTHTHRDQFISRSDFICWFVRNVNMLT